MIILSYRLIIWTKKSFLKLKLDSILVLIFAILPYLNPRSAKYESNSLWSSKPQFKSSSSNGELSTLWAWTGGMRVPVKRQAWGAFTHAIDAWQVWQSTPISRQHWGTGDQTDTPCCRRLKILWDKSGKDVTEPPEEVHNDRGVAQCQAQFWLLRWVLAEAELLAAPRTTNLKLSCSV